jgi:hypothetical protein
MSADRLLWAWLCEVWIDWRSSLVIVKPETVIGWHRKGFQLFWTWKVRHGQPGRPAGRAPKRILAAHLPNQLANLSSTLQNSAVNNGSRS